ncbi:MAG: TetR/AcrR family transcriptional regulator [Parvibaculales bacterium]
MTTKTEKSKRRTQPERRAIMRKSIIDSAVILFGSAGYENTSLDQIATLANITTGPIYHYFRNKKDLFQTVTELMEDQLFQDFDSFTVHEENKLEIWNTFLTKCLDPAFRQIVLLDGPNILGRDRWAKSSITNKSLELFFGDAQKRRDTEVTLRKRLIIAALTELAVFVAEHENPESVVDLSRQLFLEMIEERKPT